MSELFNFILQLGFWQWCGVLMLSSIIFPCLALAVAHFRLFTVRVGTLDKSMNKTINETKGSK